MDEKNHIFSWFLWVWHSICVLPPIWIPARTSLWLWMAWLVWMDALMRTCKCVKSLMAMLEVQLYMVILVSITFSIFIYGDPFITYTVIMYLYSIATYHSPPLFTIYGIYPVTLYIFIMYHQLLPHLLSLVWIYTCWNLSCCDILTHIPDIYLLHYTILPKFPLSITSGSFQNHFYWLACIFSFSFTIFFASCLPRTTIPTYMLILSYLYSLYPNLPYFYPFTIVLLC